MPTLSDEPCLENRRLGFGAAGFIAVCLAALAVCPLAADEASPTPHDVIAGPAAAYLEGDLEAAGLRHEATGQFAAAWDFYAAALASALEQAAAPDSQERPWATARTEVYLRRLHFFRSKTGGHLRALNLFDQVANQSGPLPASIRVWARWFAALAARSAGHPEEAEVRLAPLGLVDQWLVVGPFDNEQGQGFATPTGPEGLETLDLTASYQGSTRPVHWRRAIGPSTMGWVDLNATMRPNDQVLAYALAVVQSDQEREVELRLSSDEAVAVDVGGVRVLTEDVRRLGGFDQSVVAVTLPAGATTILVKICDRTGPWGFRLRICEPGRLGPPPGLTVVNADEVLAKGQVGRGAGPRLGANGRAGRPVADAMTTLMQVAAARPTDPWPMFHLGYLHFARGAHGKDTHPDRDALTRACLLAPDNAMFRVILSLVSSGAAELAVQREENARRQALEEALARAPDYAEAHLLLASYYSTLAGNLKAAGRHIDAALVAAPDHPEARLAHGDLLRARGLATMAAADLLGLATRPEYRRHAGLWRRVSQVRLADGDVHAAIDALRTALAADAEQISLWRELIALLRRAGQPQRALESLIGMQAHVPDWIEPRVTRAEILASLGRKEDVVATCEEIIAMAPAEVSAWVQRGTTLHKLGRDDEAIASFERALELDPGRSGLRDYMDLLREREQPFWAPWRVDAAPLVEAARDIPLDPRLQVRALAQVEVVRVQEDGRSSRAVQAVLRIENREGARAYDLYAAYHYSGEQRISFRRARLWRADGSMVDADTGGRPTSLSSGRRGGSRGAHASLTTRTVDLPPLIPGDVIEVEYRIDDLVQSFFGEYFDDQHELAGSYPMDLDRYVLIFPETRTFHHHVIGKDDLVPREERPAGLQEGWKCLVFEQRDVTRIESEPAMPWGREVIPRLQISSFESWAAFSKWYWNLIRDQHDVSAAMREKVRDLCKDAGSDMERIRRIYDFVVTDIRYNDAWEFGVHGFKPYKASSIFARRFGDCKDKATLLRTMLHEVDIDAFPVLIRGESRRGRDDLSLPLIGHFNHCIAYVQPEDGEGFFLDGTAQYHPMETLPNMDYGAKVLIVRPEGGELSAIDVPPASFHSVNEEHRLQIAPDGSGVLDIKLTLRGSFATVIRQLLGVEGQRGEILERLYGRHLEGARVVSVKVSTLDELVDPVTVELRIEVPRALRGDGAQQSLEEIPSILFRSLYGDRLGAYATKPERNGDVYLPLPMSLEKTIEVTLPPGYRIDHMPKSINRDEPWGTFRRTVKQDAGTLRIERQFQMRTRRIQLSDYPAFRAFANEVDHADTMRPLIVPGVGKE